MPGWERRNEAHAAPRTLGRLAVPKHWENVQLDADYEVNQPSVTWGLRRREANLKSKFRKIQQAVKDTNNKRTEKGVRTWLPWFYPCIISKAKFSTKAFSYDPRLEKERWFNCEEHIRKTRVWVQAPTSDISQPPLTPVPSDLTPSSGLYVYQAFMMCIYYTQTNTCFKIKSIFKKQNVNEGIAHTYLPSESRQSRRALWKHIMC